MDGDRWSGPAAYERFMGRWSRELAARVVARAAPVARAALA